MASTLVMTLMSKASEKGTNLRSAARDAGISEETAKNWIRGISEPTDEEVKKICNVLGCSVPKDKKEKEKTEKGVPPTREEMQKLAKEGPAPETLVVGEAKSAPETQKHILKATEKATMATKGDFMPPPVQEELFPKTTTQKEEKKMDNTTVVEKKIPAEDKPKKAKSASPKKTGKKSLLSEESEVFVRKSAGLKKSDELTEKAVAQAVSAGMSAIKEKMDALSKLEKDMAKALFAAEETTAVDERLKKLLVAGEKASDEGIALAVTILEKFRK